MKNEEIIDQLLDIALWCEKQDRESKSDSKYYYWAKTIREAREKINVVRQIEDNLPLEDKENLVSRLVLNVKWDTHRRIEDGIKPCDAEWSDDTKAVWKEIEDRLTDPNCLDFDMSGYLDALTEEVREQDKMSKACDPMTSYHRGIISGIHIAKDKLREFTKKRENEDG